RGAETVGEVADEGRERAHQQHGKRVRERPQLAADLEVRRDRLLEYAEALPRPDADGENHGPADHGNPEAALLRGGGCGHAGGAPRLWGGMYSKLRARGREPGIW